MSCNTSLDHSCRAWPGDSFMIPIAEPKSYNQFYINFHVEFTYPPTDLMDDDDLDDDFLDTDGLESITHSMQFWVPCDRLMCHNTTSWSTISDMLSTLRVPLDLQPFMIHHIATCAQSMVSNKNNLGKKVLPMEVSIGVVDCPEEEEEEEEEGVDTMVPVEAVPASESSVEALEKLKVENSGNRMQCVICLEDFLVGSEATRMPCSHVFHGDCIVRWLGVSNLCPLCRFQMPT